MTENQNLETDLFLYPEFLQALLKGDRKQCSDIANALLGGRTTINVLYEEYIKRALYGIGELWAQGKISVATEHMASAIAEALINEFYFQIISGKKNDKTVVVACVENEYHQIGIKMVADIFEMHGWNAHFLGANTPTKDLISFINQMNPDLLALSLSLNFNLPTLEKMIYAIRHEFPELYILVGGQAFRHGGQEVLNKFSKIIYKPDLPELEQFIKKSI